jgi:hypothetical protein
LEHFRTQHELARNFYDDVEFCPLSSFEEVNHDDFLYGMEGEYELTVCASIGSSTSQ